MTKQDLIFIDKVALEISKTYHDKKPPFSDGESSSIARLSYRFAGIMLKEREVFLKNYKDKTNT